MAGTGLTGDLVGRDVFAASGERLGQLVDLYADIETDAVAFAGVAMLRHGRRRHVFVSLAGARLGPASVTVQCGKDLARRAPYVRPGEVLPADAEQALFVHYEIPYIATDSQQLRLKPRR